MINTEKVLVLVKMTQYYTHIMPGIGIGISGNDTRAREVELETPLFSFV